MAEWEALIPIMEVCDKETDYEGGWRHRGQWWKNIAAQKQLSAKLIEILAAAMVRRWKSVRSGEGGGGREVADLGSDAERGGTWYAGTDTGDAQVRECSCMDAQRQ